MQLVGQTCIVPFGNHFYSRRVVDPDMYASLSFLKREIISFATPSQKKKINTLRYSKQMHKAFILGFTIWKSKAVTILERVSPEPELYMHYNCAPGGYASLLHNARAYFLCDMPNADTLCIFRTQHWQIDTFRRLANVCYFWDKMPFLRVLFCEDTERGQYSISGPVSQENAFTSDRILRSRSFLFSSLESKEHSINETYIHFSDTFNNNL